MKLFVAVIVLLPGAAFGQAWTPPFCVGENLALQYGQQGWICTKIVGQAGPAGPAGPQGPSMPAQPTSCITANWNGTAWTCVPTEYLVAK